MLPSAPAITRRHVLGLIGGAVAATRPASARGAVAGVVVADGPGLAEVVDPDATLALVYDAGLWCEGPVWWHGGLVFSDVRRNCMFQLAPGGSAKPLRDPSRFANGNAVDAEGRLLSCEQLTRRVVRREPDGTLSVLVDRYRGKRLNSPNDLIVARDGAIWFTDPTYGLDQPEEGRQAEPEQPGRFVFRLDPGGQLDVVADSFEEPNGIALSPDERVLYVSETSGGTNPEGRREIRAFDIVEGRRLARERVFATVPSGVPDGLKTDTDGRLYAATDAGARIWAPDGTPLGHIATPATCGNLAFGGPDGRRLHICNGTSVHAIATKARGVAWRA